MLKHSLSMINYLSMNYLPIFSRWLWKYVVYIINISLLAQIIGSHFWWYLCSIFSFQPTKYSLSATDRIRNPPTLLRIIRKSLFFFQQCSKSSSAVFTNQLPDTASDHFHFEHLHTVAAAAPLSHCTLLLSAQCT